MGSKKQTIGYRYYFSIHMGLGRGPVNEIAEIRVGDLTAFNTIVDVSQTGRLIYINKPELFGGEKKEGGVQGPAYIYNGADDQQLQPALNSGNAASANPIGTGLAAKVGATATVVTKLPSIAASLGGDVPNFRGVVTVWFDGLVCALNPYPKEWAFRIRRSTAGWWENNPWYPAKALINLYSESGKPIHAMNGAHMLYEANTNPEWGRGMPPELIDENSFIYAANTLCAEGFGLCIPWFRQDTVKEFIASVINHIGAVQYVSRETGLLTLKLIRADYTVADLPLFTPDTGLLSLDDSDSSSEETAYNEIIVQGFDPSTKEEIQIRVQNLASIQSQEEIISNTIQYSGLPTRALVARVAQRELKVQLPLRKFTLTLDRRGWRISPGMVFRISYPAKGISNIVVRAGECTDTSLTDGKITIKAVEDIFGMPETAFVDPAPPIWTPPNFDATPPAESRLYEVNWRDYYLRSDTSMQDAIDAGTSYIALLAKDPPNTNTAGFDILTKPEGGTYENYGTVGFTNWLTLSADISYLDDTLVTLADNTANWAIDFNPGMAVLIDDEQMEFITYDDTTYTATLKRGVADTIPAKHSAGTTIWLIDDDFPSDNVEYQDGETVYGKALTRTSADLLSEDEAEEVSIEVNQRVNRAYPPGNVKVNAVSIYDEQGQVDLAQPVISWAHRDRKTQADILIGHTEGDVGPELGVTYNIRIYDDVGTTLLGEHNVGNVTTWTYDSATQLADGAGDGVWMELESVRLGLPSMYNYRFKVNLGTGWSYSWGFNWGGDE